MQSLSDEHDRIHVLAKVGLSQRFEVAGLNVGVGSSIKIFSKIRNNN